MTNAQYKLLEDGLSYTDVMALENRGRMDVLEEMNLVIEVVVGCRLHRAISAKFVNEGIGLCNGKLWEAGRIAQVS